MSIPSAVEQAIWARAGKAAGRDVVFRCPLPGHRDEHPSCRFNLDKETWYCDVCKKGGGWTELAALLGVEPPNVRSKVIVHPSARKIVATYDYVDEAGTLLYQVVRYDPKDFLQRRPDGSGGWTWGLDGTRRVLYRLADLRGMPLAPVYLVEGEKDADRLAASGLVATTAAQGAGKWNVAQAEPPYAESLRGRHVVILPDNDLPGKQHARDMAAALLGVAGSVRIVELPGLPAKGDVSDWLALGHTVQHVRKLASETRPLAKAPDPEDKYLNAATLQRLELPDPRWAVPDLLPEGTTILGGKPKMGKSWMALDMALGIAAGTAALGRKVECGDVLYLALEDNRRRLQSRLNTLLDGADAPERLWFRLDIPRIDEGGLDELETWCKGHPEARLIVVDILAKFRPARQRNGDAYHEDYAAVSGIRERISDQYHLAVLVVHHLRKMAADDPLESLSGTMGLSGAADGGLVLKRERGQMDAVLYGTGRDLLEMELALRWDGGAARWHLLGDAEAYRTTAERQAIFDALRDADEPLSPAEVAGRLKRNRETTRWLLWRMWKDNMIQTTGTGKYHVRPEEMRASTNAANPTNLETEKRTNAQTDIISGPGAETVG